MAWTDYDANTDDEQDDQQRALARIMSPASAESLVPPMQGVSNPPNGGAVTAISPSADYAQPVIRPAQSAYQPQVANGQNYSIAPWNPDPNASLRPGGSNPQAQPGALSAALSGLPNPQANVAGVQPVTQGAQPVSNGVQPAGQTQLQPAHQHGKFARVLGGIANAAGSWLEPGLTQFVPGSSLYNERQAGIQQARAKSAADIADVQSQVQERAAQGRRADAQAQGLVPVVVTEAMHEQNPNLVVGTMLRPADYGKTVSAQTTGTLRNQGIEEKDIQAAAAKGQKPIKDSSGKVTGFEDDTDSAIYASRAAQDDLRRANTSLAKAKTDAANADPSTAAGRQAIAKLQSANAGHAAAMIRANASMINAKGGYMGTDENGTPLNGIGTTPNGRPIGTHIQSQYTKNAGNIAKFQDVYSSVDNANAALDEADKSGAKYNTAKMAEALSDPKTTSQQWLAGKVNTTLTPQEQNLVITTKALREQLNAMRSSIGGGVSDSQVNRLVDQLPGPTTPDMAYARKQLATVRGQLDRLQAGLPGVNNGPTLQQPGAPANPTNKGGVPKSIPKAAPGGGLIGPVKPGEVVAIGPGGHQIVARGGKWVDPTTGKEVK